MPVNSVSGLLTQRADLVGQSDHAECGRVIGEDCEFVGMSFGWSTQLPIEKPAAKEGRRATGALGDSRSGGNGLSCRSLAGRRVVTDEHVQPGEGEAHRSYAG